MIMLFCDKAEADSLNGLPTVTVGKSLSSGQRKETIAILTQEISGQNYTTLTVTGNDLVKYLNPSGDNFTTTSGVWSSALIVKTDSEPGIRVKILPYNGQTTITTITADQYKNAALTAGIENADIYITSPVAIDGSGALAGIYAAYADKGKKLNQDQINAAQDEINTLSSINQNNRNKSNFSDAKLNRAIVGAKKDMAQKGGTLSDDQIRDIINNQIKINHLGNTINNNQINEIVKLLEEVQGSGSLKNKSFVGNAQALSHDFQNMKNKIKSQNNSNVSHNNNFLNDLWNQIVGFFNKLFNN
ncbi:MAG: DUF1002 domain-containing protein [Lactobacillus johnsonii]|nr:DUF1002 domain-containing protein [Lactobacillus johnsonii]MCI6763005.1 DUF1002 domain-containing protein [Lactobacillus johnsonii]